MRFGRPTGLKRRSMARKLKSDKLLFTAMLLLVCTSVVMVYSASAVVAMERQGSPYYFLIKQGAWSLLGLSLVPIVMRIDYRHYRQPMVFGTGLVVVVIALIAVLFTEPIKGASRWLGLGPLGGVQPSELAKLVMVMFTASLLERRMDKVNDVRYAIVPLGIVLGLVTGLIYVEPDMGTAASIVAVAALMLFAAGLSYRYIAGLAALMVPVLYLVIVAKPYRMARVWAFFYPENDPLGSSYQMIQSAIAVGSGGLVGRGLMAGVQKLFYLPEPHNDFILAVIGEELGLWGTTFVVACFAVIAWRGLRAAAQAPDRFGAFLAIGLTGMICVQALLNMSVVLGLLPTKGITLPFVSAGGSSLLVNMMAMGILLNVSQQGSMPHAAAITPARPVAQMAAQNA